MIERNPFMRYIPDLDAEAEKFLSAYGYEDSITVPMPVPIWDIAKRMSLEVIQTECLSYDDSVQGAIAFSDGIIDVYDWNSQELVGYEVHAGIVFIDATIGNAGRIRNTLAHECFHWYKHRHYFNYNRVNNNGQEFAFRCEKSNAKSSGQIAFHTDTEIMEWQAKMMAPRILMPKKAAITLLADLMKRSEGFINRTEVAELMVTEFANTFEVSRQSAAIRMVELGFTDAEPYCSYDNAETDFADGAKYRSQAKAHRKPVDLLTAFKVYSENEMLRETLHTGAFIYADGYFVLNDQLYVSFEKDSGATLTTYAKDHLAECTLDFSTKLISTALCHAATPLLYRNDLEFETRASLDANTQNTELFNKAKDFEKRFRCSRATHKTATQWLWERMQEEHWNSAIFQANTNLDAMNFTRVQKPDHKFKIGALVAMGVGLRLTLAEMDEVLSLAGLSFDPNDRDQQAYAYLFSGCFGQDIDKCNEFLREINVPELGSQQRQ
jgi:hypothetical protein